ncbi:Crp/Fnr family transcriptional regulator [Pseudoduganella sp. R-31]|uniref:Crp/Fnr family transcriptional regulator n=1 Tax=Pseudoduganella sp. R-31 TaxID=3404060 RepID=UPI003CEFDD90
MEHLTLVRALRRLEQAAGLQLPEVEQLAASVQLLQLREREFAFHEGDACPRLFAVRTGLLKQFYTTSDGKEWIKSFTVEDELFACPIGFQPGGRTSFGAAALEASVLEVIDWRLLDDLGERHLAWQKAIRFGFQALTQLKMVRERDLLMYSPEQMYQHLLERRAGLVQRVPQKELAAYLGVTPVGLNRIARRLE